VIHTELLVVGAGPAGLSAALAAAENGARVAVVDRAHAGGGQLVKQTHRFFGSEKERAGTRGFDIATILLEDLDRLDNTALYLGCTVVGIYDDGVVLVESGEGGDLLKFKPSRMILATGASERPLAFENNDLPGVYGAGAVQTLMNVHGVRPGRRVLMVGSGNIGLIVSYQLLQAGVEVAAIVEALPRIGGYLVHASKVRRAGVPILTSHTVTRAIGEDEVQGAEVCRIDETFSPVPGSERRLDVDTICLAVGLSPLVELMFQAGCRVEYVPELGGYVPWHDEDMMTSVDGIYVCGDAGGVEEASSAMATGRLAGLAAARSLGRIAEDAYVRLKSATLAELDALRSGPTGAKIRAGLRKLESTGLMDGRSGGSGGGGVSGAAADEDPGTASEELNRTGVPSDRDVARVTPPGEALSKGPKAIVECYERIPCNPCATSCKTGAIAPFDDINDLPRFDPDKCNGCGACIARCPGLAIFVVDLTYSESEALVKLPYEFLPLPEKGEKVRALSRAGEDLGEARVVRVQSAKALDHCAVVWLAVPKELAGDVRFFRVTRERTGEVAADGR